MSLLNQIVSTAILCFICTNFGILYTLPSSTVKLFSSENTTLDRIMTETELSLMGSISSASTFMIAPLCGYILNKFGRKLILMLLYLPQLLAWLILVTIYRVEAFIFAMVLCGLSGTIFVVISIYVNEYCDPPIRGRMSSTSVIFDKVGVLLSYLFGGLLDYNAMMYTGLTLNVVGLGLIYFLKESPLYLMKKGFEEEAAKSIAYFKGTKSNSGEVIKEIENIRQLINTDLDITITPEEENLKSDSQIPKKKLSIVKYLIKSRSSRRGLIILLVFFTLCIFQGQIVVQIFAGPLFEAAIPSMTSTLSTVLFAIIQVIAGCIGAYLSDKIGRRILIITTSFATGIFCVILATNLQFHWASQWLTAVLIYVYTFTFILGAGTVPYLLLGEIFLPEIKGFAATVCVEWALVCNFSMLYMFIPLFNAYGLGPLFYFFGGVSFCTTLFSFIYLPETKSLPVDVIQKRFLKRIKY